MVPAAQLEDGTTAAGRLFGFPRSVPEKSSSTPPWSEGFPWADSDIYGNRNVRIWANYLDRVFVAIANAATATGPLYVWRNVSHRMGGMYQPEGDPDCH
jgi:hypothetical protein